MTPIPAANLQPTPAGDASGPWLRGVLAALLVVASGSLIGASLFTFHVAQGKSYFSDNPQACTQCHIMRGPYDSWIKSSHHGVATCNDCHVSHHPIGQWLSKADNGFRHSWAFTFQNFHEPIQMHPRGVATLQQNCVDCHRDAVRWMQYHPALEIDEANCVRCHGAVGHAHY